MPVRDATLYFSALGVSSVSAMLPWTGFSLLVTFWPVCNEISLERTRQIVIAILPGGKATDSVQRSSS